MLKGRAAATAAERGTCPFFRIQFRGTAKLSNQIILRYPVPVLPENQFPWTAFDFLLDLVICLQPSCCKQLAEAVF